VLLAGAVLLPAAAPDAQEAERLTTEALADLQAGRPAAGVPKARRALALQEAALGPDHTEVAAALNTLGLVLQAASEYASAAQAYERALAILERRHGPEHPDVATMLNNLGVLRRVTGDYAAAARLYERVLAIRERAMGPAHPDVAQALNNLALVRAAVADYASARALQERAQQVWERVLGPEHPDVAAGLNNTAAIAAAMGDHAAARALYERALAIRERTLGVQHPSVAQSLNNLAVVSMAEGDYAGARARLERAVAIWQTALGAEHADVATGLHSLGLAVRDVGDLTTAQTLLERALRIRERRLGPRHPSVAATLNDLGLVHRLRGDQATARRLYTQALVVNEAALGAAHPDVARSLGALAYVVWRGGDAAAARPLYERSLAIRERAFGLDHPELAPALWGLAGVLADAGDRAGATARYARALDIARARSTPEWRWRAALALGRMEEAQGRLHQALALYRESVETIESLGGQLGGAAERATFLKVDNRLEPYERLAQLLLTLHDREPTAGHDRMAWAVLEARKGRLVAEALSAKRPLVQDAAAAAAAQAIQRKRDAARTLEEALHQARSSERVLADRVQNLTALLARSKSEYLVEVKAFLERYPRYRTQLVDQQAVDPRLLAKFAARLPVDTLAVQYFAAPDALYVFVVAPGGAYHVKRRAVRQRDLYALVTRYRERVAAGTATALPWTDDGSEVYRREVLPLKQAMDELAAHLLGPIETELAAHANLVLIPNDVLLFLPFHALAHRDADGRARFLAETHRISYVTQLEIIDVLRAPGATASQPLLALANPDGTLPASSREVRELRGIRPAVTTLDRADATKSRFLQLAAGFPDLHLATHGVLDAESPERSYLLLAGADETAQRLSIAEIAGLSLPANGLTVLSACETALGEAIPGAALTTLAAAFSQAGAQTVVASLWQVNDAATREFMVAFHRALALKGRAEALQDAQRRLIGSARTAHPFYWAAFVLIGAR
jgi:CHAT domain-containing protein/Tfp pilus assembly protein PilF